MILKITKVIKRYYKIMDPEEYLFNKRENYSSKKIREFSLEPLKNANHSIGSLDEITLLGIPKGEDIKSTKDFQIFKKSMLSKKADLIFLQMKPENFIFKQRFLSHKTALNKIEDYHIEAIDNLDPEIPYSWEECIVNLSVLDMLEQNKLYNELDLTKGYFSYSYPYLRDKNQNLSLLSKNFISNINKNVIDEFSEFNIINQTLYESLLGKQKVLLGDIPETWYRKIIANSLSWEQLKDLFKYFSEKLNSLDNPISFREACENLMPHIFQSPKDLYMTSILKESFQASTSTIALIGNESFNPIKNYWIPPPNGINFSLATHIPDKIKGETDENLIEKHALLDSILEKRAWGKNYITNPFSYLTKDITKISKQDLFELKKTFNYHYIKYEKFKKNENKKIPTYNSRRIFLMENKNYEIDDNLKKENKNLMELIDNDLIKKISDFSLNNNNFKKLN